MKYLLTILLFLFIAFPALAAKTVEGTVPELKPLQPPPEGVFLDYENSLNSPARDNFEESDSVKSSNENKTSNQSLDEENAADGTETEKNLLSNGSLKNIFFVIFTLAVLLAGGYYLRKGSK